MSCGAPEQGRTSAVPAGATVIAGVVESGGKPVDSAYVRLLDGSGEFTAEVVTSGGGQFRFFAAPGRWTLRALSRLGGAETSVLASAGVTETRLVLAG